ncbi:11522_t:CDS:2, partial [Acaulospora colombiana]
EDEQDDIEMTLEGSDDQSMSSPAHPSGSIHDDAPSPRIQDFDQAPHSEWIKIEPQDIYDMGKFAQDIPDDELTDHEEPDEDEETEGWVDLLNSATSAPPINNTEKGFTMGETSDATEYDQEKMFKHLCARQNNLKTSTSNEGEIEERFTTIRKDILAHGGQVTTDVTDPKLTHVVLDNDDLSRRITLMRLTEKWVLPLVELPISDCIIIDQRDDASLSRITFHIASRKGRSQTRTSASQPSCLPTTILMSAVQPPQQREGSQRPDSSTNTPRRGRGRGRGRGGADGRRQPTNRSGDVESAPKRDGQSSSRNAPPTQSSRTRKFGGQLSSSTPEAPENSKEGASSS